MCTSKCIFLYYQSAIFYSSQRYSILQYVVIFKINKWFCTFWNLTLSTVNISVQNLMLNMAFYRFQAKLWKHFFSEFLKALPKSYTVLNSLSEPNNPYKNSAALHNLSKHKNNQAPNPLIGPLTQTYTLVSLTYSQSRGRHFECSLVATLFAR